MTKERTKGDVRKRKHEDVDESTDENNQKTHYFITPTKRHNNDCFDVVGSFTRSHNTSEQTHYPQPSHQTPFLNLFGGKESDGAVESRYELYSSIWKYQLAKINTILNNTNIDLFEDLIKFINQDHHTTKLPLGFLQLSSNTANNLRILGEFNKYLAVLDEKFYKVITIGSKNCANVKAACREIIKQFLNVADKVEKIEYDEFDSDSEEESDDNSDEIAEEKKLISEDQIDVRDIDIDIQGRVNYDLDIIDDWCHEYFSKGNSKENLRITIIFEDTNSINNHILNQLIRLLHAYSHRLPIKLIMGVSSNNISSWINNNFNNENRIIIDNYKFKSNDNKSLGYVILNELFLKHDSDEQLPLLLDPLLTSIILNRFEYANNSIDSLIAEIKLSYMIHFYQLPLSPLISRDLTICDDLCLQGLHKLSSFKTYIEMLLRHGRTVEVKDLLTRQVAIWELFQSSRVDFINYKSLVINIVDIVDKLQALVTKPRKQKFEIYKLIIRNRLLNSFFLNDILKSVKGASNAVLSSVVQELMVLGIHGKTDAKLVKYIQNLEKVAFASSFEKLQQSFTFTLQELFQGDKLNKPITDFLFYEVFTINGGSTKTMAPLKQLPMFEENYENLMLNLVRPNLRSTLELALDDCSRYLNNPLVKTGTKLMPPTLNQLFRVYKEAPVSISIYDFYMAFKQSIDRKEIGSIVTISDDDHWNKLTYSWFIQNCFELMMMGLLKEKPKGDYLEKAVWKGV